MPTYIKIGRIVAVTGLKGELVLEHNLGKKKSLKTGQAIFIEEKKNSFIPWFVELSRANKKDEIVLVLEGVHARETAMPLLKKEIWLREEDHTHVADKKSSHSLLGFTVIDNKKELGEILEIIEQPHQVLCRLDINGKEVLIPLHEESIEKIDRKHKKVFVNLPEGLLEIYLND
jgi:16S rRNA processing protein RimM